MSKLKIIHLLASHKWTGPAEGVVTLCRDLKNHGHDVRLFCTPNSRRLLADQAVQRGVTPETDLWLEPKHPILTVKDILRLKNILRSARPDILHLHLSADHWIGSLAARWAGGSVGSGFTGRIVRTIHHPRTIERRPFRSRLYESMTDGFVTFCERDRGRLRETYRIDPKPVSVIHGAVDATRFHPDVESRLARAEFGIKTTTPVIGMVARFQPHRRHDLLLKAYEGILKRLPTARLLLVGRGEHQPVLERLVTASGFENRVIFAGYRDRDLPQMVAAMDVAVLLASGSDGSCRAALEAMAVGRPVVGFPVGALPETIVEGVTGHLVKEENAEALADCLSVLLSDQPRLRSMGEAARKRIEAEFTEPVRLERTEFFYQSLIGI
ncbi:MAG: glycosyltransferase family 4 protein [Nitrospirae bacterium]|nr:glycosyltransferase family 4 protein [Nitrospirota bacterium]